MNNPISKYIDSFVDRRVELKLKASAGKVPPIPKTNLITDTNAVVMDYFRTQQSLYRKEIDDWIQAREARHNPINPLTWQIQQLYKDALVDVVLRRQTAGRILRVTNKTFQLKDASGEVDTDRSKWVKERWFRKMVRQAMHSKFYGYSLVYINQWEPGRVISTINLPRELVIPEKGMLLKKVADRVGLSYADFPNHLIYIQLEDDAIGLYESVAPLTILKRHSWASWDDFEQIFGIPLRIARTMVQTEKHLNELESMLQMMGSASYAILPKTDEIDIQTNSQTDAFRVFNEKRKAVNEEICIGINGQTMTTLDGSSRSQSETHLKTQEDITDEDITDVKDWFNENFINVMRALGYDIPEGYSLDIMANTRVAIEDKAKIDLNISQMGFQLDKDYIEETYNVVLDKKNPTKAPTPGPPPPSQLSFFQ